MLQGTRVKGTINWYSYNSQNGEELKKVKIFSPKKSEDFNGRHNSNVRILDRSQSRTKSYIIYPFNLLADHC